MSTTFDTGRDVNFMLHLLVLVFFPLSCPICKGWATDKHSLLDQTLNRLFWALFSVRPQAWLNRH